MEANNYEVARKAIEAEQIEAERDNHLYRAAQLGAILAAMARIEASKAGA